MKRMFPTTISGIVTLMIGVGLCGSGIKAWGGGAFCADNMRGILPPPRIPNCFTRNITTGNYSPATCFRSPIIPMCSANGFVMKPYGDAVYVGTGLSVVAFLVAIELFGSPFMRNCNVALALFFGCFISGVVTVDGKSFWNEAIIERAPGITFVFVKTFPLSIYGPMIIPSLICFIITTIETIGDITAVEEGSHEPTTGPEHDKHIQGGTMSDGLNSILACLCTSLPNTTFSQNNGIIVLTNCASRMAGIFAALWLLLWGIIAKFGAFFVAIPDCVLGGMTAFLFANVAVSGIKLIASDGLPRRDRVIAMIALGAGIGVAIVPGFVTNSLWDIKPDMTRLQRGVRDGIIITLSTPYCIAGLVAVILHLIMPMDPPAQGPNKVKDTSFRVYPTPPESEKLEVKAIDGDSSSVEGSRHPVDSLRV